MSKRADQIHKDQQSTDYKSRTDDPRINEQDKHRLHDERGKLARDRQPGENDENREEG